MSRKKKNNNGYKPKWGMLLGSTYPYLWKAFFIWVYINLNKICANPKTDKTVQRITVHGQNKIII